MTKTVAYIGVALAVLVTRSNLHAEDAEDRRAGFEADIERMKREEPDSYAEFNRIATFQAQMVLARLGYGTGPFDGVLDEKTQAALRKYEQARRIPVTADPPSFDTFQKLQDDSHTLDYDPISLPGKEFSDFFWDEGYFRAGGTWVIQGERHPANPEQTSTIECKRERGTCVDSTAIIYREDGDTSLQVVVETYPIERWDKYEIVTKPIQQACTRYVLRFNRVEKYARGMRTKTSSEGICRGIESEKQLKLADGFSVYWDLHRHGAKIRNRLMQISPELIEYMKQRATR